MDRQVRIEVDQEDCTGCGLCEERAPGNLELAEEEAVARVAAQPANEDQVTACLEAAEYCPIGALSVAEPEADNDSEEDHERSSAAAAAEAPSS